MSAERALIVAMTRAGIMGRGNRLPWHLPEDLRRFRELTLGHTLIMGRHTFEAIGRPLEGRRNIVVSRTLALRADVLVCRSFGEALAHAEELGGKIFFIGGVEIYRLALRVVDTLVVSWVEGEYEGDVRFPPLDWRCWKEVSRELWPGFAQVCYRRVSSA